MNPDERSAYSSKAASRETNASGRSTQYLDLDDEVVSKMLEAFGPLNFSEFQAISNDYKRPRAQDPFSTPLGWQPEAAWANVLDDGGRKGKSSPRADYNYLMQQAAITEEANPQVAEAKKESLIEWFDRSVESELRKRRDTGDPSQSPVLDAALAPLKAKHALNLSKGAAERMAEASASRVEIAARLETDFTTELTDAVEKLAKAETMAKYTEALKAAEEATLNAPPELMEQLAAAEARRVQTSVTALKDTVPGFRPIEVVGYVGITKPVYPKKPT